MMYDEHNLYVAFKCWDDKDKIRATVAKRDNVFGEDNVRMWLDTFNDQRRAIRSGVQSARHSTGRHLYRRVRPRFHRRYRDGVERRHRGLGMVGRSQDTFKSLRYTAGKGKSGDSALLATSTGSMTNLMSGCPTTVTFRGF